MSGIDRSLSRKRAGLPFLLLALPVLVTVTVIVSILEYCDLKEEEENHGR